MRGNGLLIQANDYAKAYSCMDQGDMGVVLLRFRRKYGVQADGKYVDGQKCMKVITEPTIAGGLRTRKNGCSWFHGKTSRSSRALGWTLNKHLHACRSLADAAKAIDDIEAEGPVKVTNITAEAYRAACREGIRQMVYGEVNLASFYAGARSWLFYSVDGDGEGGRFNADHKNGTYHLYCMRLLSAINDRCPGIDWTGFPKATLLAPYQLKLQDGLYVNSVPSPGGNFEALPATEAPLSEEVLSFFETL